MKNTLVDLQMDRFVEITRFLRIARDTISFSINKNYM